MENVVRPQGIRFKYSKSTADFVWLKDKDNLMGESCAAINDDPLQNICIWFTLKESQRGILECRVKSASFPLEKVTDESKVYTVLVYFFH